MDGDGTYITDKYTVDVAGCYTCIELLIGDETTPPAGPSLPGAVSETVLVSPPPTTPQVNTQISRETANVGDTIIDPITVTGSDGFEGALKSRPLGPVAPLGTQLHLRVPVSAGSVLPQPTGSDVRVMALAGLGLVVIGGAAAFATRRRKLIAE